MHLRLRLVSLANKFIVSAIELQCVNLAYPLPGLFSVGTRYRRWKLLMKIVAREKKGQKRLIFECSCQLREKFCRVGTSEELQQHVYVMSQNTIESV